MSATPELAELDAMLDATLAELGRRATADMDAGEGAVSFGVGTDDGGGRVRVRGDAAARLEGLLASLIDDHVIETGAGAARMRTRVGWRGDTSSELPRGVTAVQVAAHLAATAAALEDRTRRLHELALVLSAAGRIAAMIAVPGGAVMALPLAYECVRSLRRRRSESTSNQDR